MKKIISLILALLTALSLTACGGGEQAASRGSADNASSVSQLMESAANSQSADIPAPALPAEPEPDVRQPLPEPAPAADGIDVDLTQMSATLVYAEVSNMLYCPDDYVGKVVRMAGKTVTFDDETTGQTYYAIIIPDATACCAQGIEYLLADGEYPEPELQATVTGEFELYEEYDLMYCRLKDAAIET